MKVLRRCPGAAALLLAVLIAIADPAQAWCIWGFGWCETRTANPIAGEYMLVGNPGATLTITVDEITSKTGPVSFSAHYSVKSADGKNVAIEVGPPEPKETVQVQVEKDLIKIRNTQLFPGDWKKKAGGQ